MLRDGGVVTLRPVTPEDRERIGRGLRPAVAESRRLRFHEPRQSLTSAELEFLTTIDQDHHVSWCACLADGTGVGIARYVLDADERGAEIAIAVIDARARTAAWAVPCCDGSPRSRRRAASSPPRRPC